MIDSMLSVLESLGGFGLRWLWIPLLLWTVLAVPVHLGARAAARWDVRLPFWLHRAVWWALPAGLMLSATGLIGDFLAASTSPGTAVLDGGPAVWIGAPILNASGGGASAAGGWLLPLVGVLTLGAVLAGIYHLARLAYGTARLRRIRTRGELRRDLSEVAWRLAPEVGVHRPVQVLVSEAQSVPMTFGWWTPVIVVPAAMAERDEEVRLALTHELIHIRRGDYRESWVEELLSSIFSGYPPIGWFRRKLSFFREVACDAELLERFDVDRTKYARLLLRIAEIGAGRGSHALAMSETPGNLEERIRAMSDRERRLARYLRPRFVGAALGGVILFGGTLLVACSEITGPTVEGDGTSVQEEVAGSVGSPAGPAEERARSGASDESESDSPEVFVAVEEMPELIGGIRGLQQEITYPESARRAGIEGRVIVQFEVDRRGEVENARVLRGVSGALDREALRVVRGAEFRPGRQRGRPVRVKMSLPISYALGETDEVGMESETSSDASPGSSDSRASASEDAVRVMVNARGEILIEDGPPVDLTELQTELRRRFGERAGSAGMEVDLVVQDDASTGRVAEIQQTVRNAGALQVNYRSVE